MKALLNPQKLPRLTLVLGMAGLVLQNLLFAFATYLMTFTKSKNRC